MNNILFRLFFVLYVVQNLVIADEDDLLAVSPLTHEETMYPELEILIKTTQHFPKNENDQRDKVCQTIAGSTHLRDVFHIVPIRPEHPEIFREGLSIIIPTNITGPYSQREILIGGNLFHGFVFPCSTWNYKTENFAEILFRVNSILIS